MRTTVVSHCLIGLVGTWTFLAPAVSPDQVRKQLAAGQKVTFIDVRPTALFQVSHIPNAINVPATLVPQKQLPPLGHVIVYDGGLGPDTARSAAATLALKKGISAEVLDGGFAAWEQAKNSTTRPGGVTREELPMISYAQLKQTAAPDVTLVDLRQPRAEASGKAAAAPLTDLASEFPGARITHSAPLAPTAAKTAPSGAVQPLLVLIDNGEGDGAAERMARALKANGVRRFAILVGGESIIARKGQPGLQRLGTTVSPPRRQMASPPTDNHR